MLGAIGVVFGDIGTSPLYAMKESFIGPHPLAADPVHIFGVLSLVFWMLMMVVTFKYVAVTMRAHNKGEGGSFALLALISRTVEGGKWTAGLVTMGVLAAALFYGDAIITPAISVLSAVEGLAVAEAGLAPLILPVSVGILIGLFLIQARGTARVGAIFGPVVLVYFATLAVLGVTNIMARPEILGALNPVWAVRFFEVDPGTAFLALGSVVLAVTGAEALYADMGHFGRKAIGISWLTLVYPCLTLNYLGQGALLLGNPQAVSNPFFLMAPEWARLPLVGIATLATIIASQAVISGAFSVTRQAIQLGFLPRLSILHTSAKAAGQIYIPVVNWTLLVAVVLLVVGFQASTGLAAAYGIAVTGTMFITTCMVGVAMFRIWKWKPIVAWPVIGLFVVIDGVYFASNLTKFVDGGWFPLLVAAVVFVVLTTWSSGRRIMRERLAEGAIPLAVFIKSTAGSLHRIRGTSVFMASSAETIPSAMLHNIKHNQVLHERVVILTVQIEEVPHWPPEKRSVVTRHGEGFNRVVLRYGFMDEIDVPHDLANTPLAGAPFNLMTTSFFLGRQKLIASKRPGMALWRERLFAWMNKNSESAMEFFKLPTNRVVELGSQLEI
ncbi:potassium transporter Kup [Sphingomonas sp. RB56-2]|uniref:Probable potassium transport system protein Kup n=2 Tax=Sphingomonas brevis TaxID=2908206 RepID=A0ABT0S640_9SPHN|nr:potassium transporter Kup [Sphingomonas brevis]MCL6739860.1 potassium transporter Kup [Sphingomonas brevis]